MARRARGPGLAGGTGRWVSADEVRDLADELERLRTLGDLDAWAGSSSLAPELRSGVGRGFTRVRYGTSAGRRASLGDRALLTDADRAEALEAAIINLAVARRLDAIEAFAAENRIPASAAAVLCRCPVCDRPVRDLHDLYCGGCADARVEDVAALLADATASAPPAQPHFAGGSLA